MYGPLLAAVLVDTAVTVVVDAVVADLEVGGADVGISIVAVVWVAHPEVTACARVDIHGRGAGRFFFVGVSIPIVVCIIEPQRSVGRRGKIIQAITVVVDAVTEIGCRRVDLGISIIAILFTKEVADDLTGFFGETAVFGVAIPVPIVNFFEIAVTSGNNE